MVNQQYWTTRFLHCWLLETNGLLCADSAPPFDSVEIWFSEPLIAEGQLCFQNRRNKKRSAETENGQQLLFFIFKGSAAQVSGHRLALCPENWSRWLKVTFATVVCNCTLHNKKWTQYIVQTALLCLHTAHSAKCSVSWPEVALRGHKEGCFCILKSIPLFSGPGSRQPYRTEQKLDVQLVGHNAHIWVSFCRTGKMAVLCHIFSKSRAFVWLNLIR